MQTLVFGPEGNACDFSRADKSAGPVHLYIPLRLDFSFSHRHVVASHLSRSDISATLVVISDESSILLFSSFLALETC